jgi:hypothetical protein
MNKTFYIILIFFLGLSVASTLLQSIIRMQLGGQMFFLDSFSRWFLTLSISVLAGSILLIKYYHFKKYRFVFITGIISVVCNFGYAILIFIILKFHKFSNYNIPLLIISLSTGMLYAFSLLLPKPEKGIWLKISGFLMIAGSVIYSSALVWYTLHSSAETNNKVEKISEWVYLGSSMIYVSLIIHFIGELKRISLNNAGLQMRKGLRTVSQLAAIVSFICMLTFGIRIYSDCNNPIDWAKLNFEKTKKLAQLCELRTFVNSKGEMLLYRILKPLDYDPTKKYPLVVSLPYGGQPGNDYIRQIEGACAAELLSTDSNRKKYPAFIFIPHCPPGGGWGGIPYYPSIDSLVFDAIRSLNTQFNIDSNRRYVTGISRGGYGAWNFICKRPDLFAAAIPVCGGGDTALASKAINVAVWAFHGKNDKNVPVSNSRDMINAMKSAGGYPRYTEFPDEAHNIWYKTSITPGLWDWLFSQKTVK